MIRKDFIMKTPEKKKKDENDYEYKKKLEKMNLIKVNIKKIHQLIVVPQVMKNHQLK